MRIKPAIHLVASGHAGFALTHALDCNVYMVETGAGYILFDSGAGLNAERIVEEIRNDGIDPRQVIGLFLTHAHADHSGGAVPLSEHLPGLTIFAGAKTAAILAEKDERLISLDKARGRFYPRDYPWTAPQVSKVLAADEPEHLGDVSVTLIETPGHSADHASFLLRTASWSALIGGDVLFAGGKVILQDIADCSVSDTIATIRRLATIDFDGFLPGHGAFSLADGRRHVDAALRFTEQGLPPPSFFQ